MVLCCQHFTELMDVNIVYNSFIVVHANSHDFFFLNSISDSPARILRITIFAGFTFPYITEGYNFPLMSLDLEDT